MEAPWRRHGPTTVRPYTVSVYGFTMDPPWRNGAKYVPRRHLGVVTMASAVNSSWGHLFEISRCNH